MPPSVRARLPALTIVVSCHFVLACLSTADETEPISYARDVRPILQAHCFGCHQGAKKSGDYIMTSFDSFLAGGESGSAAIVPGNPSDSYLMELITPVDGEAQMPPERKPLSEDQIRTITIWIQQGAKNDSKPRVVFDRDNPPTYTRLPVITSLAFSPDGKWLATSGFSEVMLLDANKKEIAARLVGMSPRIESFRFSPDGKFLAVAAGMPGEFGELQVWDVQTFQQVLSKVITHDTIYGVSWSPDGRTIAVGCADTVVRAFDRQSGEQVLYQNAHEDWIRDTVFSTDGAYLVSVGRDMTCKLTEVAEQRFVDNITSITPGVLRGGLASVARHPQRDEVLIGGADGIPKVYRLFRQTKRVIGDDANLIRRMPKVHGRIQSVAVSNDGRRMAVGSSLDGRGEVNVYSFEFDSSLPDEIKAIQRKVVTQRTPDEKKKLNDYVTKDVRLVSKQAFADGGIYAISFDPSGKQIVAGGPDGQIRLIETETGRVLSQFAPIITIQEGEIADQQRNLRFPTPTVDRSKQAAQVRLTELTVEPSEIEFRDPTDYVQLVVIGTTVDGTRLDLTRDAEIKFDEQLIDVSQSGLVQPIAEGQSKMLIRFGDADYSVLANAKYHTERQIDFARDVAPVLSRIGCNAGTCHGSASGKNGFQLSLRGYDPLYDFRALTDDLAARRVNVASPDESLMLLKPTGQVPHQGGKVLEPESKYYSIIRKWIAEGARLESADQTVVGIEVTPQNPVIEQIDSTQQMRVVATYLDGTVRDVTREAFIESSNTEVASAARTGVITAIRRGESAIMARYEGSFAAATLTVMGDRASFVWHEPPTFNKIDELVAAKWKRMKILPSRLTNDYEFVRRIHLDLTGLPPSSDVVRKFVADSRETQVKRDELIDELIASDDFVNHWTNKWADLLQVNRKYLGPEGAASFRKWIYDQVKDNVPYDNFVRSVVTASGSNKQNPAAAYYKILRSPDAIMENTTHLFLATRFNCNKCHDHPFERWTQDQYYETAAFFAQVGLKKDPVSKDQKIGGTAVEGAKPLYEIIFDRAQGEVTHDKTGAITKPVFPFDCDYQEDEKASRREQFAAWLTSPDNPYFAKSYVNRLWGYLLGTGLIEPIDDIRAGNPPTNPELLEYLRSQFLENNFDMRHMVGLICKSRTYQLAIVSNEFNDDDHINYSHAKARRLPAEVLFDSIHFSTGSRSMIPGYEPGIRAAELPDAGARLPSGFLATLGRPPRESVCECDRTNELQLGSVLALVSGPDQARAINDPSSSIASLVGHAEDDETLIDEIFMRLLNRPPTKEEIGIAIESLNEIEQDHNSLIQARDARARLVAERLPRLKQERDSAIAAAKKDLDEYIAKTDPELPKREKIRADKIAVAEKALNDYKSDIGARFEEWRTEQLNRIQWYPVVPSSISQTSGANSELLPDRSIRMLESKGLTVTEVIAESDLSSISAIRLEVLADPELPGGGPGLAKNGNFVLTEFEFEIASRDRPDDWKPVKLVSAISDFDQKTYPIKTAIDGNFGGGNGQGWAVVPQTKKSHWGVFELELPVGFKNGSRLKFKLHQNYGFDKLHQIGRFRISYTRATQPVGLSVSEEVLTQLVPSPDSLNKQDRNKLLAIFNRGDSQLIALTNQLNTAKTPIKIDSGIVARRTRFERVSRPIPADSELTQLESDVKYSTEQLKNAKLTAAQDLVWALINSPSFLFNR